MTRKGLRSFFLPSNSFGCHGRHHDHRPSSGGTPASQQQQQKRLSEVVMEEHVTAAEAIIVKWDPEDSPAGASGGPKLAFLFHGHRDEAYEFLGAVHDLQRAMIFFVSGGGTDLSEASSHAAIVRAQSLMQIAMRRLEKEFYQILATNRDFLHPESVSACSSRSSAFDEGEEDEAAGGGGARDCGEEAERARATIMADLRDIAQAMFAAGYGKECIKVYKTLRKSAVDEGLYRLGLERLGASQVNKLDWAVLETKIRSWLEASRAAVATLFASERILLDHVFLGSDLIREAVFADIARDAGVQFLRFPESVARSKRATEKLVRILDLYEAVSRLSPEVELVFSFESTVAVRDQALASLSKLAEAVRATVADFEAAFHKKHSKSQVPGGGIHPLTRYAMDGIATLADYEPVLAEIFADSSFQAPSPGFFPDASSTAPPLPSVASCLSTSSSVSSAIDDGHPATEVAARLAWLILVLLCKLDAKAAAYRDAGLSYLFLANNLRYIVSKVRSTRLMGLLGEEWVARHGAKARQYAGTYERVAWGKVAAAIPAGEVARGEARERMLSFSAGLEEACAAQAGWVVADAGMREEVSAAVRGMVVPAYRSFYRRWRAAPEVPAAARLTPEDVEGRLEELFGASEKGAEAHRLGSGDGSVRSVGSTRST